MKITIIIPTYYKNSYKNTLNSLIGQKYDDFEIIIVKKMGLKETMLLKKVNQ